MSGIPSYRLHFPCKGVFPAYFALWIRLGYEKHLDIYLLVPAPLGVVFRTRPLFGQGLHQRDQFRRRRPVHLRLAGCQRNRALEKRRRCQFQYQRARTPWGVCLFTWRARHERFASKSLSRPSTAFSCSPLLPNRHTGMEALAA